jgi:ankyrin repeat protein
MDQLISSVYRGDLESVKKGLANADSRKYLNLICDSNGISIIHAAVLAGRQDMVSYLLAAGADVNALDSFGDTPLHHAAFVGNIEISKYLLSQGANPSLSGADNVTPLVVAREAGHLGLVDLLLEACGGSSDPSNTQSYDTSSQTYNRNLRRLCDASFSGDLRGVYSLIRNSNVDINGISDGFCPIHTAATNSNIHVLGLLLTHGADVNQRDAFGCTALHYAAFCGHVDICHLLLSAGADPQRKNKDGITAIEVAKSVSENSGVVKLLTNSFTKVENLDFSYGVALEGEIAAKQTTQYKAENSNSSNQYSRKYAVLSRRYQSLFLWTGTSKTVEGPVIRIQLQHIVQVDSAGADSAAFTVVTSNDSFDFFADSNEDAEIWTASIIAVRQAIYEESSLLQLYANLMKEDDANMISQQELRAKPNKRDLKEVELSVSNSTSSSVSSTAETIKGATRIQSLYRGFAARKKTRGWQKVVHEDGDVYYFNKLSNESVWEPPF